MNKVKPFFPAIVWSLIIITIDLIPANPVPATTVPSGFRPDKIIHLIQHLALAVFFFWGILHTSVPRFKKWGLPLLVSFVIGLSIEFIQKYFIPNRSFNLLDVAANSVGALCFLFLGKTLESIYEKGTMAFHLINFYKPVTWMIIILVLCMLPKSNIDTLELNWLPENADKAVHAGFYVILALLLGASLTRLPLNLTFSLFIAMGLCISYGIIIELMQHFYTTTRHFETLDILFNSLGAILGCAVFPVKKDLFIRYF